MKCNLKPSLINIIKTFKYLTKLSRGLLEPFGFNCKWELFKCFLRLIVVLLRFYGNRLRFYGIKSMYISTLLKESKYLLYCKLDLYFGDLYFKDFTLFFSFWVCAVSRSCGIGAAAVMSRWLFIDWGRRHTRLLSR